MTLGEAYAWLRKESGPRMLVEFLKIYGVIELPGNADSPVILSWAKELGLGRVYSHDSIPWCGLAMAVVAHRAGYEPPKDPLWALNWKNFGNPIAKDGAMLGDVLTFRRASGGHVALYVGEDKSNFHVLGGNQSDMVSIARIAKDRLNSVSRPKFKVAQPENVRKVVMGPTGVISRNEA